MPRYIIGIDVGGTNTKIGLLSPSGKILSRTRLDTKSFNRGKDLFLDALVNSSKALLQSRALKRSDIAGIGVGWPGFIDPQAGVIKYLPNMPGWKNVKAAQLLRRRFQLPVFIENDVNLITLAEWKMGAGIGVSNLLCLTVGTGVGGGLVLNDRLYHGSTFSAGEIGHVPYRDKTIEEFIGNKHLHKKAVALFRKRSIHNRDITAMARKGNAKAIRYWRELGEHLGFVLAGAVNLVNPELIIIGGGVAKNFDMFAPTVRETLKQKSILIARQRVRVVRAKLGDDAGVLGAYLLVKGSLERVIDTL